MNPRTQTLLPLAAMAGLALAGSAVAETVIANFNTTQPATYANGLGNLNSGWTSTTSSATTPYEFRYDISSLGIGLADELLITVDTVGSSATLNPASGNGIAVNGGANNLHWDPSDPSLSFAVVIKDASNNDITNDFTIDLTGVSMRWGAGATATFAGQNITGSATLQGVGLPTGETAETLFTASRTGAVSLAQVQQLRFVITDPGSDVTAPTITTKSPVDEATGVAIASNLVATFDENIALTGTGTVTIRDLGPGPDVVINLPDPQVTVSGANLTINPTSDLLPNNSYAVQISNNAVQDLATTPNAFAGILDDTTWNFSTVVLDNTAPTITTKNPADGATGVAINSNLVATFDENIALTGTGTVTIRDIGPGSDVVINLPDAQVTVSGANLTINPSTDLLPSNPYAVQISANAVKDLATTPNTFAGILDDTTWNFATAAPDLTAPTITSTSPADDVGSVLNDTNLVAIFDENVALTGTGTVTIRDLGPGPDVVINLPDAQVTVSGTKLTINPASDLIPNNPYAVQISANAVRDLATTPNAFAGILDDTTWNFTTLPGQRIVANFNTIAQPAAWSGGVYSSTALGSATPSPFEFVYDVSSLGLGTADKLRITVATSGANLNNGGFNGIAVVGGSNDGWWEQTDGALDFSVVIEDASNADITSNFNIDLTGTSIRWLDTTTPSVTLSVAGAGPFSRTATTQGVDLPTGQSAETSFTATRTGSTVCQLQQLRFAITDLTAPTIVATNPADEATDVSINSNLVATFDENIALTGTGTVTIRDLGPGPDVVIGLPDPRVTVSGANLTINPTTNLLPSNPYAVQISADAIKDLSSSPNAFAGILDDTTWNFTTLPGVGLVANFTPGAQAVALPGGLTSSTAIGTGAASPFEFVYDISGLGLGTADKLHISVATTGADLNNGGSNGIAVVGGNNDAWWEETDGDLSFSVVIKDASNADITGNFNIDLTGASIRWTGPATLSIAGGSASYASSAPAVNQAVTDIPTGETAETSFTATRTGDTVGQFQQLRFVISENSSGNNFSDWIVGYNVGGQTGVGDDPDGDGIDNGVENYFGTAPDSSTQGLAVGTYNAVAGTFTFTHPQGTLAADLTASYHWSADLVTFHENGATSGGTTVTFTTNPAPPVAGTPTTVTATVTGTPVQKLFVRVAVTQN